MGILLAYPSSKVPVNVIEFGVNKGVKTELVGVNK